MANGNWQVGIYAITHVATGRRYIGSSRRMTSRWARHKLHLRRGTHKNPKLQALWNKHGEASFAFSLIEVVLDPQMLAAREQWWLDSLTPEININTSAERPFSGRRHNPDSLEKMKEAQRGRRHTTETREKMAAARRAYWAQHPVSEAERERRRTRQQGKRASAITRAKISSSLVGNTRSVGRTDWVGRKHSPATIEKLRAKALKERATFAQDDPRRVPPLAIQNRQKTHCIAGHLFDSVNTYQSKSGKRQCRACGAARARRNKAKSLISGEIEALVADVETR